MRHKLDARSARWAFLIAATNLLAIGAPQRAAAQSREGHALQRSEARLTAQRKADWSAFPDLNADNQSIRPYAIGPGVAVADPTLALGVNPDSQRFGAGVARWLQYALSSQPALEQSPTYTGTARVFSRMHPHAQPTREELQAVFTATGASHLATMAVSGNGPALSLSLRLWRLKDQAEVCAPVSLPGGAAKICQLLPDAVSTLCKALGVQSTAAVGVDSSEDLTFLGSLPRWKLPPASPARDPVFALAQHSTLAALAGITYAGTSREIRRLDRLIRPLAVREPNNPVAVAAVAWGFALGRDSLITQDLPDVAARLQQKLPHSYLANFACSQMASGAVAPAEAAAMAREAVRCSPGNPEAWRILGRALGDQAGAIRHGAVWNAIPPDNQTIIIPLYQNWLDCADHAVNLDSDWGEAWLDVATAATFNGDAKGAARSPSSDF